MTMQAAAQVPQAVTLPAGYGCFLAVNGSLLKEAFLSVHCFRKRVVNHRQ
jgi:hypothetical protein